VPDHCVDIKSNAVVFDQITKLDLDVLNSGTAVDSGIGHICETGAVGVNFSTAISLIFLQIWNLYNFDTYEKGT
jgi:hypothetical protein